MSCSHDNFERLRINRTLNVIAVASILLMFSGCDELFKPRKPSLSHSTTKQAPIEAAQVHHDISFHDIIEDFGGNKRARIQSLIARGGDLNEIRYGSTPAMKAVGWGGQYDLAILLLKAGANHQIYGSDGIGRLAHNVYAEKPRALRSPPTQKKAFQELLAWLEAHGEDFDLIQKDYARWETWGANDTKEIGRLRKQEIANRLARENGATNEAEMLALMRPKSQFGQMRYSPLFLAAEKGDLQTVRQLIVGGDAKLDEVSGSGETPMVAAARIERFDIVLVLLDAGANPLVQHPRLARRLIHELVAYDLRDRGDVDPKTLRDYLEVLRRVEATGDSFDDAVTDMKAWLEYPAANAMASGSRNVMSPMGSRSSGGIRFAPLYAAADRGDIGEVNQLITEGASIDEMAITGATAMLHAASKEHFQIVRLLLDAGADPLIRRPNNPRRLIHTLVSHDLRKRSHVNEANLQAFLDVLQRVEAAGDSFADAENDFRRWRGIPVVPNNEFGE